MGRELLRRHTPSVLVLLTLLVLIAAIGRTYIGDSSSPYGNAMLLVDAGCPAMPSSGDDLFAPA
jgi:hypothetical protein